MQTILITGANRGLGLEFVRQYLERGDRVFATARRPKSAAALNALIPAYPDHLTVVQLDAADEDSIAACVEAVAAETGSLDLLLNNAGINVPREKQTFGSITADTMLHVLRVNTVGPLLVAQAFLPLLKQGKNQRVVNFSSGLGSIGMDLSGQIIYSTSKAALNMVSQRMAKDKAFDGMIVITLDPGWVKTDMGGPNATFDIADAITRNIRVIEELGPRHNGNYYNLNGDLVPW